MQVFDFNSCGKIKNKQGGTKFFEWHCEMCIIFCTLFAYRHSRSIIMWRRWTAKKRKLYRTTEQTEKGIGSCEKGITQNLTKCECNRVLSVLNIFVQTDTKTVIFAKQSNVFKSHDCSIFIVVAVISPTVHGTMPNTEQEYLLMHCTKLISEEHFTAGRPLVIVLPLAEEDSTNKEVGYLIEEMHTSGRWPILVFNISYNMNENM
jgi:hypothetical protein